MAGLNEPPLIVRPLMVPGPVTVSVMTVPAAKVVGPPGDMGITTKPRWVSPKLEAPMNAPVGGGGVAAMAGAVGGALHVNPVPLLIPCHRVLAASGLGGFGGGLTLKQALLQHERAQGTK